MALAGIADAPAQETSALVQTQPADFGMTCILHDTVGHPVSGVFVEVRSDAPPLDRSAAPTSPDGSITFHGLKTGAYSVTVAGDLLFPPKHVIIDSSNTTLVLPLPITLPQAAGHPYQTVSVDQLAVPEKARDALLKAFEAWGRNDLKQSRVQANRALQLHPDYGQALSLLGILELNDGRPADAIIGLQRAVRFNPNSARTYLALASAYNELHNNADALHALSIFAKLSVDSWQLHYEAGRAYLGQGRYEAALDEFNRSQQLGKQELVEVRIGKAHALMGLRDYSAARTELQTVIRQSPNGPYAAEAGQLAVLLDSQLKKPAPKTDATARDSTPPAMEH